MIGCLILVAGFLFRYALLAVFRPMASARLGLHLTIAVPGAGELVLAACIVGAGTLVGLIPAYRSSRYSPEIRLNVTMRVVGYQTR